MDLKRGGRGSSAFSPYSRGGKRRAAGGGGDNTTTSNNNHHETPFLHGSKHHHHHQDHFINSTNAGINNNSPMSRSSSGKREATKNWLHHFYSAYSWIRNCCRQCQVLLLRIKAWAERQHPQAGPILVVVWILLLYMIVQWNVQLQVFSSKTRTTTNPKPPSFLVIVLTMNRLRSLQRLVTSLQASDYSSSKVQIHLQFHIDRPPNNNNDNNKAMNAWKETVNWAHNFSTHHAETWPHGPVSVQVAPHNKGLRQAWLDAWLPDLPEWPDFNQPEERAVILEDDVEVSPLWFAWIQHMYQHYGQQPDIAGFSLQRQRLVPLLNATKPKPKVRHVNNDPFLYNLVGSIGFAPLPHVWRSFVEWTRCALLCDSDHVNYHDTNVTRIMATPPPKTTTSVATPDLVTSQWYYKNEQSQRNMWTQPFIYYMKLYNLYCLYQFPTKGRALARHWRETGAHFTNNDKNPAKPDAAQLATNKHWHLKWYNLPREEATEWVGSSKSRSWLEFLFGSNNNENDNNNNQRQYHQLTRYDWGMRPAPPPAWQQRRFRTVVITCAVGYRNLGDYRHFIQTLRRHYHGDIKMMIGYRTGWSIQRFLAKQGVQLHREWEGRKWEDFNRFRFDFIHDSCQADSYDWCLSIDFRDAMFQGNPFDWEPLWNPAVMNKDEHILYPTMDERTLAAQQEQEQQPNLILFAHNWTWDPAALAPRGKKPHPPKWHFDHLRDCGAFEQFVDKVLNKPIVNAGGFYATPQAMAAVRNLVLDHEQLKLCNDQVTLNVGLHAGLLGENASVRYVIWGQGYGAIDNVAYHSGFTQDTLGRFLGRDCLLKRVVHQYNKKLQRPLNQQCLDKYNNQTLSTPRDVVFLGAN